VFELKFNYLETNNNKIKKKEKYIILRSIFF